MKYKVVTVGGTFAYLHEGHKRILRKAFEISKRVVVGVTCQKFPLRGKHLGGQASDVFSQKARKDSNFEGLALEEGFVGRRRGVEGFLREEGLDKRAEIVKIEDMFGPLQGETEIEAMVVTEETRSNADKINKWRVGAGGLPALDIVEVEMVLAEDGEPIASHRIRDGEINRAGVVYRLHKLWGRLPREPVKRASMRDELRQPLGEVIKGQAFHEVKGCTLIAVGDVSTKRLIEAGIKPELVVFDLKVRRKKVFTAPEDIRIDEEFEIVRIKNPAGGVSKELWDFFKDSPFSLKRTVLSRLGVWVEGEEDLVALPAILFAPLGAIVVYGQPRYQTYLASRSASSPARGVGTGQAPLSEESRGGLVVVDVTEEKKEKIFRILKRFER